MTPHDLQQHARDAIRQAEGADRESSALLERHRQPKVACPTCGEWDSDVVGGEPSSDGYHRFRKCRACRARFRTVERAA